MDALPTRESVGERGKTFPSLVTHSLLTRQKSPLRFCLFLPGLHPCGSVPNFCSTKVFRISLQSGTKAHCNRLSKNLSAVQELEKNLFSRVWSRTSRSMRSRLIRLWKKFRPARTSSLFATPWPIGRKILSFKELQKPYWCELKLYPSLYRSLPQN